MNHIYSLITFLIVVTCSTISSFSQPIPSEKNEFNLIPITETIFMYQDKGGNIGLSVGDDGVFMIDDQFSEGIPSVMEVIKSISSQPVEFLLNTHHHGDHTGGNTEMAKTGTTIFSQENVRKRLEASEKTASEGLPIVTFSEDITFHYNGDKIFIFHVHNAHTDGDAVVYFTKNNVIHTGDVFFNGKYPYIDTNNGGSVSGYIAALKKIAMVGNEDTKIIPGHGDPGTLADVQFSANMLETIKTRIAEAVEIGASEEEVLAMKDLTAEFDAKEYGNGFISTEKIIKVIYNEIAN
ncbi:MBL fold metallo-hydrolase [Cochleicola gelatinilyticus]|uniref:beta-lactamase n=1 Tax=Cochleicola gelatinilyticus TaxID=1763537 RepID=A0A167JDN2_9FLAO|nr:MBL fold metallo-hydrolase [Cochleicola gelatinilyticus]OAB80569.1 hypothetical protein ULVI_07515 [Cochleicola gelatinilyticus]